MGRKKKPFYRIVVADSRAPRDGRFIEEIGYYNPINDPAEIKIDQERALYWLGVGATPTDTVKSLFSKTGINLRFDLKKRGVPEDKAAEEIAKWEALQAQKRQKAEMKKMMQKEAVAATEKVETKAEAPKEEAPKEEVAEAPAQEEKAADESSEA
jgi:small subunit ribosomal protein S16